jgi:hypothetical protein
MDKHCTISKYKQKRERAVKKSDEIDGMRGSDEDE